jgi:hypothetical protein
VPTFNLRYTLCVKAVSYDAIEPIIKNPSILPMEVDEDNENESEYRIRIGNSVKYLKIAAATFDRDTLSIPLASLPSPPYSDYNWTVAHISRDVESGELKTSLSEQQLAGVQNV